MNLAARVPSAFCFYCKLHLPPAHEAGRADHSTQPEGKVDAFLAHTVLLAALQHAEGDVAREEGAVDAGRQHSPCSRRPT